jgi:mono/diheme cytochrome c family protein
MPAVAVCLRRISDAMQTRILLAMLGCTSVLVAVAGSAVPREQARQAHGSSKGMAATSAFFAAHCTACHNPKTRAGGLDVQSLNGSDSFVRRRHAWESVVRKLRAGEMPPPDRPRPSAAKVGATVRAIEAELQRTASLVAQNPGAVTARRLNRTEYNNTIRDLLGLDDRPADDFPQDDSGYGFDNIGDVLSLSSPQMERYLAAAERVARHAVFGPQPLSPTLVRHEASGRRIVPTQEIPTSYDTTGLCLPNSLHATHRFPADGEYLFRIKLDGLRPLGSDALHLALWIDGRKVHTVDFDPTGDAAFNPDRQDFSGRTVEFRLPVRAGDHWLAVAIERMYEGLPALYGGPNPSTRKVAMPEFRLPPGLPPERAAQFRARFEARQKEKVPVNDARVSAIDVGGPYQQAKGPSTAVLRRMFTCGHPQGGHQPGCARKIVADFGRRAFRRPMSRPEVDRYANLVSLTLRQGDSFEEGVCVALQGMLVSPHFLFRIERDPPSAVGTPHAISDYELASRLSYFLWSSMPDDALLGCAGRRELRKPAVLAAQIRRMLKDPKANALAANFGGQWLQFRALESVNPDRTRFTGFDDYLRLSMRRETEAFLENMIREDRPILDLLDGKYSFLNERLARFYGIAGVQGPNFRRVDLSGTPRGGVLTQASILTVTSYPNRTSPVLRGKWVLENILNAPPPAPPPGVPNLDVSSVGTEASLRQQLEQHRKNPTCAACHARMDPLGFGLENFDAVGAWRTTEGKITIDASGTLPDGRSFRGPDGLKSVLRKDREAFTRCMASKLLTYALGRGLEPYDQPAVNEIAKRVASGGYRFSSLVEAIAGSRPFRMRRGERIK